MNERIVDAATPEGPEARKQRVLSDLRQLCSYYLRCLSKDISIEVSCFASSYRNDLDYAQIDRLPSADSLLQEIASAESVRRLVSKFWRERNQKELRLGYPIYLNRFTSKKTGKDFFKVEPLLLLGISTQEDGGRFLIDTDSLDLNPKAIQELTGQRNSDVLHEILMLMRDVGLENSASLAVSMQEMANKIGKARPEWAWQEPLDPDSLNTEPIGSLLQQGIYNRAALFLVDRAPYTRGLERELNQLAQVDAGSLPGTALWHWLGVDETAEPGEASEQVLLAEPFPLNLEQYQAVQKALTAALSTVTGPPGTGKSQVVANIVINALLQGQRVLFSSKNNKAVDVVVERVNNLTGIPLILRLGDKMKMEGLSAFLQRILHGKPDLDANWRFKWTREQHQRYISELEGLRRSAEAVVDARNRVDDLERPLGRLREEIGQQAFQVLVRLRPDEHSERMVLLQKAVSAVCKSEWSAAGLFARLVWKLVGPRRLAAGKTALEAVADIVSQYGLDASPEGLREGRSEQYLEVLKRTTEAENRWPSISEYAAALRALQSQPSLYDLARQQQAVEETIAGLSTEYLRCWQELLPAKIEGDKRRLLGEFVAVTKLLVGAVGEITPQQMARYYQLLPSVSNVFTCWAVTNLSAGGRVPFQAGLFDLLVIDEASQCDIASALPLMYRSKRAVIIGDPQQLSHITKITQAQDLQLLSQFGLDRRHNSWSYSTQSLFALADHDLRSEGLHPSQGPPQVSRTNHLLFEQGVLPKLPAGGDPLRQAEALERRAGRAMDQRAGASSPTF